MRNISAIAIGLIALSITSALPAVAVNEGIIPLTTERVHKIPISEPIVNVAWVGIGGQGDSPEFDDCLEQDSILGGGDDVDVGTGSLTVRFPSVVLKAASSSQELLPENSVESAELTDLCKATVERLPAFGQCPDAMAIGVSEGCEVVYAHEPQQVGVGRSDLYVNQSIDASMTFDDDWHALSDSQMIACRIANPRAASTTYTNERNRGIAGGGIPPVPEPVVPSERMNGVLDPASCVDQTEFLNLPNPDPGSINSFTNAVPVTSDDPVVDLEPGLWATCIASTLRHVNDFILVTAQDYTWFWVDSAGNTFALRDLWGDPTKWDGEDSITVSSPDHCGSGAGGIGPVAFPL